MTTIKNLVYISSWDEITWLLDFTQEYFINRCMIKWDDRTEVRQWIHQFCRDDVYIWNGVTVAQKGDPSWPQKLTPDEQRCYILFTNQEDQTMFLLKYASRFSVVNFDSDLPKAWRDSRI